MLAFLLRISVAQLSVDKRVRRARAAGGTKVQKHPGKSLGLNFGGFCQTFGFVYFSGVAFAKYTLVFSLFPTLRCGVFVFVAAPPDSDFRPPLPPLPPLSRAFCFVMFCDFASRRCSGIQDSVKSQSHLLACVSCSVFPSKQVSNFLVIMISFLQNEINTRSDIKPPKNHLKKRKVLISVFFANSHLTEWENETCHVQNVVRH